MEIFTFKTYDALTSTENEPLRSLLTRTSETKLKKLTIASMASTSRVLSYDALIKSLDLKSARELEDLLMDCLYSGLIQGHLDQKKGELVVSNAFGRDVAVEDIPEMIAALDRWNGRTESAIQAIDDQIRAALTYHQQNTKRRQRVKRDVKRTSEKIKRQKEEQAQAKSLGRMMMRGGF